MDNTILKKIIQKAPTTAGIYKFKNERGKPIYIGKALNLKNRLTSYLRPTDHRIVVMVDEATSLEFISTENDIEALILESQLIKEWHPKFNIVLRDDKQYSYVAFTNEKYSRVFVTHQPVYETAHDYIGPFTDSAALKITLRVLRRSFPYCTCKQLHNVRCLNAHIGKCPGFCCLKEKLQASGSKLQEREEHKEYEKNIRTIKAILNGEKTSFVRHLKRDMLKLGKEGSLEQALALRNRIERVERIFENIKVLQKRKNPTVSNILEALEEIKKVLKLPAAPRRIEGYDISNISGLHATGSMVVFEDGQFNKNLYRKFKIKTVTGSDDTAMLREVIERRLNHPEWPYPDVILIDGGKGQLNVVLAVLASYQPTIHAAGLTKNKHHTGDHLTTKIGGKFKSVSLTRLSEATKNLILAIDSEAHRFAISYYRKLHRKSM